MNIFKTRVITVRLHVRELTLMSEEALLVLA